MKLDIMSLKISIEIDYQLEELIAAIHQVEGIKVADLRIHQLISEDQNLNHGIYIFKNNLKEIYVGKCTSRSFVERISAHFDNRDGAWMNTILKKISKSNNITIQEAYFYFLKYFQLILIPVNTEIFTKTKINTLEKELINQISTFNK